MSEMFIKTQLITIINNLKQFQKTLKEIAQDNSNKNEDINNLKQEITKIEHMLKNIKKQLEAIQDVEINRLVKQPEIFRRTKNEYCKILKDINNQINDIMENISIADLQSSLEQLYNNYAYFRQVNDNYQEIFHRDFDGKLNMFKKNMYHNFNNLYLEICLRWRSNEEKPESLENHYRKNYTTAN